MINRRHVLAVGAAAAVAPSVARAEGEGAFDAALTAAFDTVKPVALAGGVVTDEGLVWSGVRGVRRAGRDDPATLADRWHLGSNTKAMTAALFARLVEQGRARWAMPLAEVFPDLTIEAGWDGATLDDFMTHTAGLKDEAVMGMAWLMTARADPRSLATQRRAIVERALSAPPSGVRGTFAYGNANYVLVGAAIEVITGGSWEEAMQAEVFGPLGLTSAGFGAPETNVSGGANAWGHRRTGETALATDPADPGSDNPLALGPAGTVHMTAADYARFLKVFLTEGDGWLKPETVRRLVTPGEGRTYACGWIVLPPQPWARGPVIAHEGSNTLWHAIALVDPAGGRAVLGLSNDGGRGGPACQALAMGILRAL
ncbi:serine hydrolase domain-containing protein [Brevundimonas sp. NPDC055814]